MNDQWGKWNVVFLGETIMQISLAAALLYYANLHELNDPINIRIAKAIV